MKKYATQKLSDPTVRNAKPQDKIYRLRDGGGACIVKFLLQVQKFGDITTVFTENKRLSLLESIPIPAYRKLVPEGI